MRLFRVSDSFDDHLEIFSENVLFSSFQLSRHNMLIEAEEQCSGALV